MLSDSVLFSISDRDKDANHPRRYSCSRQLREGTLAENGLQNDSRLTLLPSVETGLLVSWTLVSCTRTWVLIKSTYGALRRGNE